MRINYKRKIIIPAQNMISNTLTYKFCHLIVIDRPGVKHNELDTFGFKLTNNKDKLKKKNSGYIYFSKGKMLDISSSDIRGKIIEHKNLTGLVPENVINYIKKL